MKIEINGDILKISEITKSRKYTIPKYEIPRFSNDIRDGLVFEVFNNTERDLHINDEWYIKVYSIKISIYYLKDGIISQHNDILDMYYYISRYLVYLKEYNRTEDCLLVFSKDNKRIVYLNEDKGIFSINIYVNK